MLLLTRRSRRIRRLLEGRRAFDFWGIGGLNCPGGNCYPCTVTPFTNITCSYVNSILGDTGTGTLTYTPNETWIGNISVFHASTFMGTIAAELYCDSTGCTWFGADLITPGNYEWLYEQVSGCSGQTGIASLVLGTWSCSPLSVEYKTSTGAITFTITP
jgi:hypothetical protein